MDNLIELTFDKSITRLAGYDYGKSIYEKQVPRDINLEEKIIIIFPENIVKLASSFIQGFFSELVEKIGISGIEKNVIIQSANPNMHKEIIDNLL